MSEDTDLGRRATLAGIAAIAATGSLGGIDLAAAQGGDAAATQAGADTLEVHVDLGNEIGKLDHVWSRCAGSDRAAITLREEWRRDLARFQKEAGLERVRFHGIFNDELGVFPAGLGRKPPNFQNVDAVYDGLLELDVRPFVELSFMPHALASGANKFGFYGANITPPITLGDWSSFIQIFVRHLVDRYGAAEVRNWYFEVWERA